MLSATPDPVGFRRDRCCCRRPLCGDHVAEFEFEVPGIFDPCREFIWDEKCYCLSMERFIEFVPTNNGKKLVCGRGHNISYERKTFIPAHEFDEGGAFEGILPAELLPTATRINETRWKIPSNAPIYEIEHDKCVACGIPPYDIYSQKDPAEAWAWLQEFSPEIVAEIHAQVAARPGARLSEWYKTIDVDLRQRVMHLIMMSRLHIDHGVPRKIGNELWNLLTVAERRFLQQNLLLRLCRKCNGYKSKKLLPRLEVEELYIATYYDGSRPDAVADRVRWNLLQQTLAKVYENRAVG